MLDITHAPVCQCCDLNKNKKYFNALFLVGRTVCERLEGVAYCWRRCVTMGVTLNFQKSIPFQIIYISFPQGDVSRNELLSIDPV